MKKIILICLIFCSLLSSCHANQSDNINNNHQFSKITVIKEPSSDILQYFYNLFGKDYDTYQEALDDLVDKYNKTHDNDILLNICIALIRDSYIKDSDALKMEYYSEFFNQVWTDKQFSKKTKEYQKEIAEELISSMYLSGLKKESISFYDKYIYSLKDIDDIVYFSEYYSEFYINDKNPDCENLMAMYNRIKKLEEDYYSDADSMNKIRIVGMIANYAELLNDKETADEYNKKLTELIDNMSNESN